MSFDKIGSMLEPIGRIQNTFDSGRSAIKSAGSAAKQLISGNVGGAIDNGLRAVGDAASAAYSAQGLRTLAVI